MEQLDGVDGWCLGTLYRFSLDTLSKIGYSLENVRHTRWVLRPFRHYGQVLLQPFHEQIIAISKVVRLQHFLISEDLYHSNPTNRIFLSFDFDSQKQSLIFRYSALFYQFVSFQLNSLVQCSIFMD